VITNRIVRPQINKEARRFGTKKPIIGTPEQEKMMEHDFKASLRALQDTDFNSSDHLDHRETWEAALRLAERMQVGKISQKTIDAGWLVSGNDCLETFKAMTKQLMKEIEE
jgi:LmbE family N-acetylglucosaminyl deacetylase